MIISRLKLQNIRSYRETAIELPMGKTLFEGDIGSGKSTLLMAIEFALFGLGSETGGSLLRTGEAEGRVGIDFQVEGGEYSVLRKLVRKGDRVQQAEGELSTSAGVEHLSPSELKERILEILGFNEPPDPKSQSVIYRYAVYTPQEEMKTVIFMRPDLRLQTLRRAFRVEDYKTAKENASELSKRVRSKRERFEAMAEDARTISERILEDRSHLDEEKRRLSSLSEEELGGEKSLSSLKSEREKLRSEERKLDVAVREISLLAKLEQSGEDEVQSLSEDAESLEKRIAKLRHQANEGRSIKDPSPKSAEEVEREIAELERHTRELERQESKIEGKIEDYKTVQETGSCPTCDREADPKEFVKKTATKESEKEQIASKIAKHMIALEKAKSLLEKKEEYKVKRERLGELAEELSEYEKELGAKRKRIDAAVAKLEESRARLRDAQKEADSLKGLATEIEKLDARLDDAEGELRRIRDDRAASSTTVKKLQEQLRERESELEKKERYLKRAETLREHEIWLDDYFVPTLDAIEKHVLMNLNQEFNTKFQEWFAMLVDDAGKEARVDENFTPIVEQDGYEQEVYYLSGGEKTSLALAYRLALNTVVQKVSTGMKTNLMIFDEPTDGFSKEQLGRVREILDELQSPQIVVVSHEKELESFADQIFRVVKINGESKVVGGS